jgi:hypothetical protein
MLAEKTQCERSQKNIFEIVPPHEYESEHKMLTAHEHLQVSSEILDAAQLLNPQVYSVAPPTLQPSEC